MIKRILLNINICPWEMLLKSLHVAQSPEIVRNLMSGPVSVSEDGSNVQLLQRISWQPPVSQEVMMYFIRCGMGVHNPEDASFNVTTTNTCLKALLHFIYTQSSVFFSAFHSPSSGDQCAKEWRQLGGRREDLPTNSLGQTKSNWRQWGTWYICG